MMRNEQDEKLIDSYFKDERVRELLVDHCGEDGKIEVDWAGDRVTAIGTLGQRVWDLNEMLTTIKTGGGAH